MDAPKKVGLLVKALVFMTLLMIFYIFFFVPVMKQYSQNYTNLAKIETKEERIELPTFSVCTGWRKSLMKKYKISYLFMYQPPDDKSNLPPNATIRSLFDDLTYKLNQDFVIGIGVNILKPTPLNIGINEINAGRNIYKFNVKQSPVATQGLCYIIIPDQAFLRQDYLAISIAKNNTPDNIDLRKVKFQVSSNDTFNTLFSGASGTKNHIME